MARRKKPSVGDLMNMLGRVVPGSAQWVWKCPDCGGDIVAQRMTDPEHPEQDGLLQFEHAEPICPAFDDGDSLEDITHAWLAKKFQFRTSGDGLS